MKKHCITTGNTNKGTRDRKISIEDSARRGMKIKNEFQEIYEGIEIYALCFEVRLQFLSTCECSHTYFKIVFSSTLRNCQIEMSILILINNTGQSHGIVGPRRLLLLLGARSCGSRRGSAPNLEIRGISGNAVLKISGGGRPIM